MRRISVSPIKWFLILSIVLTFPVVCLPGEVKARSSFWISSRDKNACIVSAVIQYDLKFEKKVQQENGISNAVLKMDINTREPQELCTVLMMRQNGHRWRPLLCVTNVRGNIYSGYLVLPREFNLDSPIEISLGERTIEAKFMR